MRWFPLVMACTLAAFPCGAQISGSINKDAPVVQSRIEFAGGGSLEVRYTAILYGKGEWLKIPENEPQRRAFNDLAKKKPLGMVTTSDTVIALGNVLRPGKYDLFVSITIDRHWVFNLQRHKVKPSFPITWHMHMQDVEKHHPRLKLGLEVGEGPHDASFAIAFGKKELTVPLEVRVKKKPTAPTGSGPTSKPKR